MHRDPTLRKRNALVIPGVLLILASVAGIAYVQLVRDDSGTCDDGQLVVLAGACRSATLLLVIPLAVGVLLAGLGAAQRKKGACHLGHGTAATTTLVVLATLLGLALLATLAVYAMDDPDDPYVIPYGDADYGMAGVLGGLTLVLALVFIPYLALYLGTRRPPRCCRDKQCFEPCFCDEEPPVPVPTFPLSAPAAPGLPSPLPATPDNAQVTKTPWTGKPARDVAPLPPIQPDLPPPPAPEAPKPLEHDVWPAPRHGDAGPEPAASPASDGEPSAAPKKAPAKPRGGGKTRKVVTGKKKSK